MSALTQIFEGKIDFHGQNSVDLISRAVLVIGTIISFIVGFSLQSLQATFILYGAIVTILALVVIPPWPIFNQHPVKWLPVASEKNKIK